MKHCPLKICDGTGFIPKEVNGETILKLCDCKKQSIMESSLSSKLDSAHMPIEYRKYTFEDFLEMSSYNMHADSNQNNVSIIEKLISDTNYFMDNIKILWIYGLFKNVGCTTIATLIARSLIQNNYKVRFIRMESLLSLFSKFDSSVKDLDNYDIFVIDGVFESTFISPNENKCRMGVSDFFNTAIDNNKRFIFTADKDLKNCEEAWFEFLKFVFIRYAKSLELKGTFESKLLLKNKLV
jgi:chromosomal replication initiation ATPase DnaA